MTNNIEISAAINLESLIDRVTERSLDRSEWLNGLVFYFSFRSLCLLHVCLESPSRHKMYTPNTELSFWNKEIHIYKHPNLL